VDGAHQAPENRTTAVQTLAQKVGCRFEALYYSLGEYDGFVILEAPDETTVTAFVLAALGPDTSSDQDDRAHARGNVIEAMKKAGALSYQGPRK